MKKGEDMTDRSGKVLGRIGGIVYIFLPQFFCCEPFAIGTIGLSLLTIFILQCFYTYINLNLFCIFIAVYFFHH